MAIELCSDNSSLGVPPRISFSHDLCQNDDSVQVERHHPSPILSSTVDFDFHVRESFYHDSSSADELFSDGKIRAVQIKKKTATQKRMDQSTPLPPLSLHENGTTRRENSKTESSKDDKMVGCEAEDQKQSSKSFWRFKRSSSLNCGSGYGPSLCPLPLLSRSNSTGSASSVKRSSLAKDGHNQKQHSQKNSVKPSQSWFSGSCQKPPLKKGYGAYGNGVHINPVLHVPSASLFGFGSIFSNGRDKNKKK